MPNPTIAREVECPDGPSWIVGVDGVWHGLASPCVLDLLSYPPHSIICTQEMADSLKAAQVAEDADDGRLASLLGEPFTPTGWEGVPLYIVSAFAARLLIPGAVASAPARPTGELTDARDNH